MKRVEEQDWRAEAMAYESAMRPWFEAYRDRRSRHQVHPVHDFLFEYYQVKRLRVERWHPSVNTIMKGVSLGEFDWISGFEEFGDGAGLLSTKSLQKKEIERLKWIEALLLSAMDRPARFLCYGLHEWAMVYRSQEIRHESTPLRLSMDAIAAVVESRKICCTHWDAFRFFTDEARPFNTVEPTHEKRHEMEQFGCVHFNMDLYKWCYKAFPWVSSELTRRCFELALEARSLDMRASPYDVSQYDLEPIMIETPAGSQEYQKLQQGISAKGRVLAGQLLEELKIIVANPENVLLAR